MPKNRTRGVRNSNRRLHSNRRFLRQDGMIFKDDYDLLTNKLFNLNVEIDLLELDLSSYHFRMESFKQQKDAKQLLCAKINADETAKSRERLHQLMGEKEVLANQLEDFKEIQERKLGELQDMLNQSQFKFMTSVTSMQTCIEDLKCTTKHMGNYLEECMKSHIELESITPVVYGAETSGSHIT